jgi:hypothetical protein
MAPVAPQVSYQNEQLTIVANNSTLGDILRAVRKQTGADIDIPSAPDRVVTHLGPGSPRDVMAELLNGSRFNYVLLGSPADNTSLTRVVLVAKSGQDNASPNPNIPSMAGPSSGEQGQPGVVRHSGNPGAPAAELDANAMDAEEDNDTPQEQPPAEAEQPPAPASTDQPGVKTPQQMLQEMQQRQLQLQQQQQQQGQQPTPPPGIPQRPPQE